MTARSQSAWLEELTWPQVFRDDAAGGGVHGAAGARGDPTLAGAGKDRAALAAMAAELVDGLRALHPEQFDT